LCAREKKSAILARDIIKDTSLPVLETWNLTNKWLDIDENLIQSNFQIHF